MSKRRPKPIPEKPVKWWLSGAVVLTAAAALVLLLLLARNLLAELNALGGQGGSASTRLLTGLFVVMCLAGFTATALWTALKRVWNRPPKEK
ncbi:MAG: hypothetical protein Q8M02_00565 [Candidatus Didemnitutus sp.]|nr:hypothetical protein [Candidatus Didemnitutus sp.]